MKTFAAQAVVVLAIVSGFTMNSEAQTVAPVGHTVTIASSIASVGVLAN